MKQLLVIAAFLTGCVEGPEPTTETAEQHACRLDPDNCPGWPVHCTPIGQCNDSDVLSGWSCPAFKKLPTTTTTGAVHCGNNLEGLPTCIATNSYDFGLVRIDCVTVTEWFGDGQGGTTTVTTTDCHQV